MHLFVKYMSAETTYQPEMLEEIVDTDEQAIETEPQTPADRLHDVLAKPYAELKEASLEEVRSYEQALLDVMHANTFSARSFAQIAESFRPALQKKLKDPAVVQENTLSHIVDLRRLCHERFAKEQAEFEKQERLRIGVEAELERQRVLNEQSLKQESEQREAWNILQRADEYGEQQFADWNDQRIAVDNRGKPREIHDDHRALVDKIEARARQQKLEGRNFHEVTARMERGFGDWLDEYDVFGKDVVTRVAPVHKYDDITKHIDDGVVHTIPGVRKKLGIDFSVNGYDTDLARKLNHGIETPIERITYGTVNFGPADEFIPIVLTLDDNRAQRLLRRSNFEAVMDSENPVHRQMAESFATISEQYHDREILQYTIVEEALEQVRFQLEEMQRRQLSPEYLADHQALVTYLEQLLAERKNLRDVANAEVEKETVKAVYRTRDRDFIRAVVPVAA